MDPLDLANPLQGTDSTRSFSRGNTWPLVGVPRGMTYWTPQTSDGRFTFNGREPMLSGFRATHAPSPWMGDYGHFSVMPVVGPIGPTPSARGSSHTLHTQRSRPDRYGTRLLRYGIDADLTASSRCALLRCLFPPGAADPAVVFQGGRGDGGSDAELRIERGPRGARIVGIARAHHGGVPEGFGCYFVADVQGADVTGHGTFCPGVGARVGADHLAAPRAGGYLRLRPTGPVTVRIATSFISHEQAQRNLSREVGDRPFDAAADAAARRWRRWFDRARPVGGDRGHRRRFYCALYRLGLFPSAMHEPDEHGRPHHYSPYDGRVHGGVLYTNNGFWDTHRTVYPLLARIDPEGLGEIVEGFLQAYRHGGWLPKWASPGYRNCMVGTHADAVIAEAVAHDIPGFDHAEAYEAIRKNAFEPGDPDGHFGRVGLEEFARLGYVPGDIPHSVSRTLDFAYSDWCIAQVALRQGREDDAATLLGRSRHYQNLWHAGSGFMRPRDRAGEWVEPWDAFTWGGPYVEGGPWQHSFNVPHDLRGLARLCGGTEALVRRLKQMLTTPPRFEVGSYGREIHEMTEMALARDDRGEHFGQYAHSNQPVHGVLWMLAALGEGDFAARHIRRVCESLYTPDDLPGDEDNGQMSAWYLFAAMGRYPLCPGSGRLVTCDPGLFEHIELRGTRPTARPGVPVIRVADKPPAARPRVAT